MNPTGGKKYLSSFSEFRWSPDGNKVAFLDTFRHDLYIAEFSDTGFQNITRITDDLLVGGRVDWSSDSKTLAFSARPKSQASSNNDIYTYTYRTNRITQLTSDNIDNRSPAFLPNRNYILYVAARAFYLLDIEADRVSFLIEANGMTIPWLYNDLVFLFTKQDRSELENLLDGETIIVEVPPSSQGFALGFDKKTIVYSYLEYQNTGLCIYDFADQTNSCFKNVAVDENGFAQWGYLEPIASRN